MKPFKSIREGNSVEPGVSEINDVPEDPLSYVEIKPKKAKVVKKDKVMGEEKEMQDKEPDQKAKDKALQRAMNATPRKPAGEYERKVTSYLKKKYNEETEQIDELKTGTLLRYHTKAGKSGLQAGIKGSDAMDAGNTADAMTHFKKSDKRMKGQAQAMGKIQKRYATEGVDIEGIWESLKPEPVVEAFDAEAHKKELDRLMTKHMNAHAETTRLIKAKASQEDINKAQERNNAVKQEIAAHKDKAPKGPAPKPGSAAHYYASKKPGEYTGD